MTRTMIFALAAAAALGFASLAQAKPVTAQRARHVVHRHVVARDGAQTGRSVSVGPAFVGGPYGGYRLADWHRHWGF